MDNHRKYTEVIYAINGDWILMAKSRLCIVGARFTGVRVNIIITDHAKFEAGRKNIPEEHIRSVIENPQQKLPSKKGRVIVQSKYNDEGEGKKMILRVIGTASAEEFKVITVYKTSKIDKYWKKGGQDEGSI